MKRIALVCLFLLLAAITPAFGQTPAPAPVPAPAGYSTFSITASVMNFSGQGSTSAATDLGQAFAITNHFSLRADEILAPSANAQVYLGGFKYFLPASKALEKTNLNSETFQFYVTGGVGVDRITLPTPPSTFKQHIAAAVGGGINYDPTNSGNFSLNLIEVRWARLPGFNQNAAIVSSGLKISF